MSDIRTTYRIAQNKWNLKNPPWSEAIGIEEVSLWEDGTEVFAVPPLVCWLLRGSAQVELADRIVKLLNSDKEWLDERSKHPG